MHFQPSGFVQINIGCEFGCGSYVSNLVQLGEPFWVHKSIPVALISFVNLLWKDMDEIWGMT